MSTHEQFGDDLALLALEALHGDERTAIEKHLEDCPECRRDLERLRGDMALLALSAAGPAAPRRSRDRLLKAIAKEPRAEKTPVQRSARWNVLPWLAAAALVAIAGFFWQQSDRLA